ncbi:MAG TPA: ATP synthase F1 subunit gamma [Candidatus Magasanikbacteria bacterium]|nr:ATP synthase F1 subunit gamma [Candidatus Magasanikbacteria bacterium]
MGGGSKIIKSRIKSIGNTQKITKAMEMVSAAKMRKAVESALRTRTYAMLAWELLTHLSREARADVPLLAVRPVQRLLVILFTSNRGMCGSFNANIIKKTAALLKDPKNISRHRIFDTEIAPNENVVVDVVGVGKKGAEFAKKMGYNLVASFSEFSDTPTATDVMPIARLAIEAYEKQTYDKVVVAYTDFRSAILQLAKLRQVLPISEFDLEKMLSDIDDRKRVEPVKTAKIDLSEALYEPNPDAVLSVILPRLVETQIYQAAMESSASEHSARMMAMRNASDSADDMIKELKLNYNKARQAGITQEIAEIAGGAAALG